MIKLSRCEPRQINVFSRKKYWRRLLEGGRSKAREYGTITESPHKLFLKTDSEPVGLRRMRRGEEDEERNNNKKKTKIKVCG